MRVALVYLACGGFAAVGLVDLTAGNFRTGIASALIAVANALLLL